METLKLLTSNYLINIAFISWMTAQVLKTILTLVVTKKFNAERLFGAGGMPSSHSALVCSLVIAMARKVGFDSPVFALTLVLAAIVMYDAMGVRRAAGEHAKVINKLVSWVQEEEEIIDLDGEKKEHPVSGQKTLKEFIGHTPLEVLGGALLGIIIAIVVPVT